MTKLYTHIEKYHPAGVLVKIETYFYNHFILSGLKQIEVQNTNKNYLK
jgi:hypothetical protein